MPDGHLLIEWDNVMWPDEAVEIELIEKLYGPLGTKTSETTSETSATSTSTTDPAVSSLNSALEILNNTYIPACLFFITTRGDLLKAKQTAIMQSKAFFNKYIKPLSAEMSLSAAAKADLEILVREAESNTCYDVAYMVESFVGTSMNMGQSVKLRKWFSTHSQGSNLASAIENCAVLLTSNKLVASADLEALREKIGVFMAGINRIPQGYRAKSPAHPHLPFYGRIEQAMNAVKSYDPDDDICIVEAPAAVVKEVHSVELEEVRTMSVTTTTTTTTTKTQTQKRSLNMTAGGNSALDLLKAPTKEDIRGNGKRRKGLDLTPTEFKFLVVLDYEGTCDDKKQPAAFNAKAKRAITETGQFQSSKSTIKPHAEIIEWGCVLVDMTRPAVIVSKFQEFVKPKHNPTLTTFCKDLTAIKQKQVDEGSSLKAAIAHFETWLRSNGVQVDANDVEYDFADSRKNPLSYAIVTWSDTDLGSTLNKQMMGEGLSRRRHFDSWINLKLAYKRVYGREPHGLRNCVEAIGVKFERRAHSGLVDAENTAAIVLDMVNQQKYKSFTSTTSFLDADGSMIRAKGKRIENIAMAVGNTNKGEEEEEEEMDKQEKEVLRVKEEEHKFKRQNANNEAYLDGQFIEDDYDFDGECVCCLDNTRDTVLMPCKCTVICSGCVENFEFCPNCQRKIERSRKVKNRKKKIIKHA
ncbi:hypothetical protein TrLO_g11032 [Triparma laevis f. longispina]|uniref:RING-type domain-containing protein n=1 Tax=Triparma laevis f. longispina TaxID=1714387 RepID=A0A9W7FAB7_9STRA|nr:hypothetical protein TrLO_g11032 [Triparma laevis f. longispina]